MSDERDNAGERQDFEGPITNQGVCLGCGGPLVPGESSCLVCGQAKAVPLTSWPKNMTGSPASDQGVSAVGMGSMGTKAPIAQAEGDLKEAEQERKKTEEEITKLLSLRLESATTRIDWAERFFESGVREYEPRGGERDAATGGKGLDVVVGVIVCLFVTLITCGLYLVYVIVKYDEWAKKSLGRPEDYKREMTAQAGKLDVDLEALRLRHKATMERIVSLSSKLASLKQMTNPATPSEGRSLFGMIKSAIPIGRCPNCKAGLAAESDGLEILGTKSRLVGPEQVENVFQGEPVVERIITSAKKSKCKVCGHRWQQVSSETKTVRGACPNCYEDASAKTENREVHDTTFRVIGGGDNEHFFHGQVTVKVKTSYLSKLRCKKCSHGWQQMSSQRETLRGVCPSCYGDRKDQILKEKVRSHDTADTIKHYDGQADRYGNFVGQTVRSERFVIRQDDWETTFRCGTCSHEWKELSSEEYRVF